jgi:hypothetical protein
LPIGIAIGIGLPIGIAIGTGPATGKASPITIAGVATRESSDLAASLAPFAAATTAGTPFRFRYVAAMRNKIMSEMIAKSDEPPHPPIPPRHPRKKSGRRLILFIVSEISEIFFVPRLFLYGTFLAS